MSFKVTVRPSGRSFTVEGDETVLAAALRQGIGIAYGCKNGACGTCRGKLIEGQLAHGPHSKSALSAEDEAKGLALFCCSRPQGDVVIEARELTGFGDIPIKKMPARIARIERVTPDAAIVSLQLPATERLQYLAGQYLEFILRDGTRRHYSIATPPHADEQLQFTSATCRVERSPTTCSAQVRSRSRNVTFFASKDRWARSSCARTTRGRSSCWPAAPALRRSRRFPSTSSPKASTGRTAARRFVPSRSTGAPARGRISISMRCLHAGPASSRTSAMCRCCPKRRPKTPGRGERVLVHRAVMEDFPDLSGHQVYACGVPLMVDAARRDFTTLCGLPEDQFFADAFTSQADLLQA